MSISFETKLRKDEILFGECQSVIIVTVSQSDLIDLMSLSEINKLHVQTIGKVTNDSRLNINDLIDIDKSELQQSYFNYYSNLLAIK